MLDAIWTALNPQQQKTNTRQIITKNKQTKKQFSSSDFSQWRMTTRCPKRTSRGFWSWVTNKGTGMFRSLYDNCTQRCWMLDSDWSKGFDEFSWGWSICWSLRMLVFLSHEAALKNTLLFAQLEGMCSFFILFFCMAQLLAPDHRESVEAFCYTSQ